MNNLKPWKFEVTNPLRGIPQQLKSATYIPDYYSSFGQYRTSSSPPISNSNGSGLDLALAVGPAGTKSAVAALSGRSKGGVDPRGVRVFCLVED